MKQGHKLLEDKGIISNRDSRGNPRKFVAGHQNKGKLKYPKNLVPCACKCGKMIFDVGPDGKARRYAHGHNSRDNFQEGEKYINNKGYVTVMMPQHPSSYRGRVPEHILAMEEAVGRYLEPGEGVRHIDGNRANNDIFNLKLTTSEYLKLRRLGIFDDEVSPNCNLLSIISLKDR